MDDSSVFVTLDLTKREFVRLIETYAPPLREVTEFSNKGLGVYRGGFIEQWEWNGNKLLSLPYNDLVSLYYYLKKE